MMETRLHAQQKGVPPLAFTPVRGGMLQRQCACGGSAGVEGECEGCSKQDLSLLRSTQNPERETRNSGAVPPIVNEVLGSPGRPLDAETRAFMEPRFGHDFGQVRVHRNALENSGSNLTLSQPGDRSEQEADEVAQRVMSQSPQGSQPGSAFDFGSVRIHTDGLAAESARAVNARAYTVGNDIVFGAGQYSTNNPERRSLMAHELAHVALSTPGGFVLRAPEPTPAPAPVAAPPTELAAPPVPTATIILVGSPTDSTSGEYDFSPYNFSDAAVKAVPKIVADLPGTQVTILYFSPGYKQRGDSVHKKALADLQGTGASVVEVTTDAQVISFLNTGLVTPIENAPTRAVKVSRFFYFGHGGTSSLLLNWGWGERSPFVDISTSQITEVKTEAFVPAGQSYLFTCHVAYGDKSFASVWASHVGQTSIGPEGPAAFNAKYSSADLEKAINAKLPKWFLGLPYMNKVKIVDPAPPSAAPEAQGPQAPE